MDKNSLIAVLVVAVLITVFLIFNTGNLSSGQTIDVVGTSTITAEPDILAVYVNIQTLDDDASVAEDENSRISRDIELELLRLGIERDDIETMSFNIYPEYVYENGQRTQNGFRVTNQLRVKTEEFSMAGDIIDIVVDNQGLINYINFELTEEREQELKAQAMEEAARDSKGKAEAVASGLDKRVGKLVSVQVSDYNYYPFRAFGEVAAGSDAAIVQEAKTSINPRDLEITSRVTAKYRIY